LANAFPVLFLSFSRDDSRRLKVIFPEATHLVAGGHDRRHETASGFGKGASDITLDQLASAADDTTNHLHSGGKSAHDSGVSCQQTHGITPVAWKLPAPWPEPK